MELVAILHSTTNSSATPIDITVIDAVNSSHTTSSSLTHLHTAHKERETLLTILSKQENTVKGLITNFYIFNVFYILEGRGLTQSRFAQEGSRDMVLLFLIFGPHLYPVHT